MDFNGCCAATSILRGRGDFFLAVLRLPAQICLNSSFFLSRIPPKESIPSKEVHLESIPNESQLLIPTPGVVPPLGFPNTNLSRRGWGRRREGGTKTDACRATSVFLSADIASPTPTPFAVVVVRDAAKLVFDILQA